MVLTQVPVHPCHLHPIPRHEAPRPMEMGETNLYQGSWGYLHQILWQPATWNKFSLSLSYNSKGSLDFAMNDWRSIPCKESYHFNCFIIRESFKLLARNPPWSIKKDSGNMNLTFTNLRFLRSTIRYPTFSGTFILCLLDAHQGALRLCLGAFQLRPQMLE